MFTNEDLKRLDKKGVLTELFHEEIYNQFTDFIINCEEGEFVPNRSTRTGQESIAAVNGYLIAETPKDPAVVEVEEEPEEDEVLAAAVSFKSPI